MSEPMERHISITSTTTNTNGVVTQVTHASVLRPGDLLR